MKFLHTALNRIHVAALVPIHLDSAEYDDANLASHDLGRRISCAANLHKYSQVRATGAVDHSVQNTFPTSEEWIAFPRMMGVIYGASLPQSDGRSEGLV